MTDATNTPLQTRILAADSTGLAVASKEILAGRAVAVPTETVYGLAADATDAGAVARIYAAKGRPSFNPLIVHVADLAAAEAIATFDSHALLLAERFWPGPLTIVVPLRADSGIASLVTAGLDTIAIRVPAHPVMRALLEMTGKPLAAPSANRSGSISPTSAAHVMSSLGGHIATILDAGRCKAGLESTIVSTGLEGVDVLRPGPVTHEKLAQASGLPVRITYREAGTPVSSPGQSASHYAPGKPLALNVTRADEDAFHIGFGAIDGHLSLSGSGDLVEAAARLFDALHSADSSDKARITVAPIPDKGIGRAINDRLRRAAA